jgi:diguanylate cyclase (GGDEF)-like protein
LRLTETKQRLAVTAAGHIALALANLRLRETLRMQSIRDPLTGLFNRRYMEESLARELRRAARNQRKLGAIMLDLDHFKRFNDTFGHEAGDALLRELGGFLRTRTRREDIACRYGGEEFVVILPEASIEATRQRAERLREEFKHLNVQHRGRSLGAVTLSLGVAVFPEHASTVEDIMRSADRALYRAKAEGRDRVVLGESIS